MTASLAPSAPPPAPPSISNERGLTAAEVLATAPHGPLPTPAWMSFDGVRVVLAGACLPPGDDPSRLGVEFGPGVAGRLVYPTLLPETGAQYWYWPNSDQSGFCVELDVADCEPGSDPFGFTFTDRAPGAPAPRPIPGGEISVPRDLAVFVGVPRDPTQLTRVQTFSDPRIVAVTGHNAFRGVERLLARHGVTPRPGLRVLDWGCGHGRVTRHMIAAWREAEVLGMDIDAQNVGWAAGALPGGRFLVSPPWPPAPVERASLDALFGISVMTHLTAGAQAAWVEELARMLKPGALALVTFAGDAAVAFSSRWRDRAWWARWPETGFDDGQADPALGGAIAAPAITGTPTRPRRTCAAAGAGPSRCWRSPASASATRTRRSCGSADARRLRPGAGAG